MACQEPTVLHKLLGVIAPFISDLCVGGMVELPSGRSEHVVTHGGTQGDQ